LTAAGLPQRPQRLVGRNRLPSNRLSTISLAAGGTRGFTYDANGSVTAEARPGGTYAYTYNAAGRMAEFRINGILQASYKYDAMGRQAIRTLTSPSPVTIHSVFDSQGRRIAEYNESTGALIREYIWLGWEPVAVIEGSAIFHIRTDQIGRPVFATSRAFSQSASPGTVVWSASYSPFGGVTTSTGTPITARFPGQWFQSESGLHQNWMRDYDPTTGRYLEADPLGLVDGASVYGYVGQNPMRWIDPTGENSVGVGGISPEVGPKVGIGESNAGGAIGAIGLGIILSSKTVSRELPWISSVPTDYAEVYCPDECSPATAPFFNSLKPHRGKYKKSGYARTLLYYRWDYLHYCEVEVFDRRGNHLGAVDGRTGVPIKGPDPRKKAGDAL
jgi:RHS repeat-associated protein